MRARSERRAQGRSSARGRRRRRCDSRQVVKESDPPGEERSRLRGDDHRDLAPTGDRDILHTGIGVGSSDRLDGRTFGPTSFAGLLESFYARPRRILREVRVAKVREADRSAVPQRHEKYGRRNQPDDEQLADEPAVVVETRTAVRGHRLHRPTSCLLTASTSSMRSALEPTRNTTSPAATAANTCRDCAPIVSVPTASPRAHATTHATPAVARPTSALRPMLSRTRSPPNPPSRCPIRTVSIVPLNRYDAAWPS